MMDNSNHSNQFYQCLLLCDNGDTSWSIVRPSSDNGLRPMERTAVLAPSGEPNEASNSLALLTYMLPHMDLVRSLDGRTGRGTEDRPPSVSRRELVLEPGDMGGRPGIRMGAVVSLMAPSIAAQKGR